MLGLNHKGHLGPGADADITIYEPHEDKERMFALPRYVIKAGQIIVEDGEIRTPVDGKTLYVAPEYDPSIEGELQEWFQRYYSVQLRNYPVAEGYVKRAERVTVG
jgi:formylmethanofuran dehydrogenase subunit A